MDGIQTAVLWCLKKPTALLLLHYNNFLYSKRVSNFNNTIETFILVTF